MKYPRIAVFASGTGSNAESLMKKMKDLGCEIEFVFSDKRDVGVLEKALRLGVKTYLVEKTSDRATHEEEVLKLVHRHRIDWIFLAGYMRLISASFLQTLQSHHQGATQIVNIHPSLLPAYPGSQAMERAFADQVPHSGITVHFVDEGMDTGKIIMQEQVALQKFESFSDFKMKMHSVEHRLYGQFLENVVTGKIPTLSYKETVEC
ncbi:phosphoribosylglycinamide formyltransferase [Bdellovibrio sp. NC01]|uniref:phosphoribosylglycinamide formyltransferase n=1 Tax=Bdellovibrio sp. NC01 TaxID=2220073 RepID=UPI001158B5C9|nr:phosphoribosylglycinamide formyltransferase [Bdellovibrio sp. NC01]QDK38835.1 phosphoribosylglycinamide formyltransferase [Bdellovibrio sp. NC01]